MQIHISESFFSFSFFCQGLKQSRSEGGRFDDPGLFVARQPGPHSLHGLWAKAADPGAEGQQRTHVQTDDPLEPR